jgi:hypothetical protein
MLTVRFSTKRTWILRFDPPCGRLIQVPSPVRSFRSDPFGNVSRRQYRLFDVASITEVSRFICRGPGGLGKRADYRIWSPLGQVYPQIRCTYNKKIAFSGKTTYF